MIGDSGFRINGLWLRFTLQVKSKGVRVYSLGYRIGFQSLGFRV